MFRDRHDAANRLVDAMRDLPLRDPLVLAIPRGGVVLGAVIAQALGAELDVVLSRKLRAPGQPELAVGSIAEDGTVYLDEATRAVTGATDEHLEQERRRQLREIESRRGLVRALRPRATAAGRSVIVTDDGIATGSTMIAALEVVRAERPHEVIVAVPVGAPQRMDEIRSRCDRVVCLEQPALLWAIGQFYDRFDPVDDEEVVELLRERLPAGKGGGAW